MRFWRWLKRFFWHEEITKPVLTEFIELGASQGPHATSQGERDILGLQSITVDPMPTVELPSRRVPDCLFQCKNEAQKGPRCEHICSAGTRVMTPDTEEAKAILEQAFPHDPSKEVRYPEPASQSASEWVDSRIGTTALSPESMNRGLSADMGGGRSLRFSVRRGFSMGYLYELKHRAERRDSSLTNDQLMALRSRGLI